MRISQKDTCRRCRALVRGKEKYTITCSLGYTIKGFYVPAEACPKPKTWKEISIAKQTLRKGCCD